jgi:hypothetical protein
MTDIIEVVGGGDSEPNLQKLGLKPYIYEKLESQQPVVIVPQVLPVVVVAAAILPIMGTVAEGVLAWLEGVRKDAAIDTRRAFTNAFVEAMHIRLPDYNHVVIHPQHSVIHEDSMVKSSHQVPTSEGTYNYDAYCSLKGRTFELTSDGDVGYENWAYYGQYNRNGMTISAIVY